MNIVDKILEKLETKMDNIGEQLFTLIGGDVQRYTQLSIENAAYYKVKVMIEMLLEEEQEVQMDVYSADELDDDSIQAISDDLYKCNCEDEVD